MTYQPENLNYLWDGSEDGWVVFTSDLGLGTIYNIHTRMALLHSLSAWSTRLPCGQRPVLRAQVESGHAV